MKIRVFDTTLRDGEQAPGCHYTAGDKKEIARALSELGVDVIEAGFPVSSRGDFDAVEGIASDVGASAGAPEIAALARCVRGDIDMAWQAIRAARRPRLHLFLATSDIHLEHKLKISRTDAVRRAAEAVRYARSLTSNVQFSAEDASRSDAGFLGEMVEAVVREGASTVNIPDTVGYATPSDFSALVRMVVERSATKAVVSIHCHNDLGLAIANSLAALQAGAGQVECTVNGIGERAGNCSLEEVVMALNTRFDVFGRSTGVRTERLVPTSRLVSERSGLAVARNKAIVGANAFAHASGIHQDGMLKHSLTYEIMRPEAVGAGSSQIVLTARSGRRALQARIAALGREVPERNWDAFFERFKAAADEQPIVTDADLLRLVKAAG